jgi:hypothetical protein
VRTRRLRALILILPVFFAALGGVGYVAHARSAPVRRRSASDASPSASATPTPTPVGPEVEETAPAGQVNSLVAQAEAIASAAGERAVVAVHDRQTGATMVAGDANAQFQSASVVKVFIAAELIWTGQFSDPAIAARAYEMITQSDDDTADSLYGLVGGDALAGEIEQRIGVTGLAPPPEAGSWGSTYITANAMIAFYDYIAKDAAVGPWLLDAMAHTTQYAADGTDQYFGIPSAASGWAVKQGWVCCEEGVAGLNSTGFVDANRDVVVILTEGSPAMYPSALETTIDTMAKVLLPAGQFPN